MRRPLLIAQITDMHVVGADNHDEIYVDNNGRLVEAVARLAAESPAMAAVLATGDLVNTGRAAEYEMLAELMAPLPMPILPIPGNHDDRALLRSTFPETPWVDADHASWVTLIEDVRVVGLDVIVPGSPGAAFDDERESWLRSVLGDVHDGVTLLALHHPPFETGIRWMDRSGFVGLDRLVAVLADHPVDRIVCGHLHRPMTSTVAGIPTTVGISTVQQVELDLEPDAGVALVVDPAGYQILRIDGREIVSHTRFIATGERPFRPSWAAEYEVGPGPATPC